MIKALILAGGYGTRLGELTKNQPKPTIVINGKTVIEQIIERLHLHKITQIIVNLHYLPVVMTEKITNKALFYYEPRLLGHDGTISALRDWLEDNYFLVINGDTISNIDFSDMIAFHKNGTVTVLMDNWRCAGVWLYDTDYFINKDLSIIPYRPVNLIWHDIGTPERLQKAKEYYEKSGNLSDLSK